MNMRFLVLGVLPILIIAIPIYAQEPTVLPEVATISVDNAAHVQVQLILQVNAHSAYDLEFSPDGTRLAVAETGDANHAFGEVQGQVRIWNTTTWEEEMILSTDGLSAMTLAFNQDGRYLAVGNTTGEIQLWHMPTAQVDVTLTGHTTWVNSLAYGPGDGLLASGSGHLYGSGPEGDYTIRIWLVSPTSEARELRLLTETDQNLGAGLAVKFSPDGGVVAAGLTNGTVHLWGVESGRELAILDNFAWAHSLYFTSDSSQILFAADDGVRIWNVEAAIDTFGNIPEYTLVAPLEDEEFIFSIALSHDGKILSVGYQDGTVRLWNMESGEQLTVLEGHEGRVVSLAFNPDGTLLASGGTDGTVRLWGVPATDA